MPLFLLGCILVVGLKATVIGFMWAWSSDDWNK
jgi:hypothetical protein